MNADVEYGEWLKFAAERMSLTGERPGQAAFNALSSTRKQLADDLPGELDPFHDDARLPAFYSWVYENWDPRRGRPVDPTSKAAGNYQKYTVVLEDLIRPGEPKANKIKLIKTVRSHLNFGLKEAKDIVDAVQQICAQAFEFDGLDAAQALHRDLLDDGAMVTIWQSTFEGVRNSLVWQDKLLAGPHTNEFGPHSVRSAPLPL